MPVFDIDDLSFFDSYGIGLRHVEREKGIKESREGASRGDAISLANYGRNHETATTPLSLATCTHFQTEVERFILQSYCDYHLPVAGYSELNASYNDAAFLLIDRGNDARSPYDYDFYPLGKCGTKAFSHSQVLLLITSDQYNNNNDVVHATYNTFIDLKNKIRQFKIQAAQQLLARLNLHVSDCNEVQRERIQTILKKLIINYQNNTFIETIIFKKIYSFFYGGQKQMKLIKHYHLLKRN